MSGANGRSSVAEPLPPSGVEIDTEEGRKPITEVINLYELEGDDVRAALMRSVRAAVLEAKKAKEAAKQYCIRNGMPAHVQ